MLVFHYRIIQSPQSDRTPVAATLLYPFINQLVAETGITHGDDNKVGYYAGAIVRTEGVPCHNTEPRPCHSKQSVFFLSQSLVVFFWGRLSDRIGRKPVILSSLVAIAVSTCCFGLSHTYLSLIVCRAVAGIFGGTGTVIRTAIGEITNDENIAEGESLRSLRPGLHQSFGATATQLLPSSQFLEP